LFYQWEQRDGPIPLEDLDCPSRTATAVAESVTKDRATSITSPLFARSLRRTQRTQGPPCSPRNSAAKRFRHRTSARLRDDSGRDHNDQQSRKRMKSRSGFSPNLSCASTAMGGTTAVMEAMTAPSGAGSRIASTRRLQPLLFHGSDAARFGRSRGGFASTSA
jgi:hypothetical protein